MEDNTNVGIEDLLDLTDTEDSTSSSSHQVYEGHRPFVLELHELKKDDPANPQSEADKKKKKKKKSKLANSRSNSSVTSSSMSESSIPPTVADAVAKEQFYDAHESFHGMIETSTSSGMKSVNISYEMSRTPGLTKSPVAMDKPVRYKAKSKKQTPKAKTPKKRKSDGPTCSMFLSELSRKLALKKRQEEESKNIVQTIIESITNALPIIFSRRSSIEQKESPIKMETLQNYAPELLPNTLVNIPVPEVVSPPEPSESIEIVHRPPAFKMPKMPLVSSDVIKQAIERRKRNTETEDVAVNTGTDHDMAAELTKHVGTLRKISLIAEEFNQKTAKNLKEIVDSVQEDLIKKLEEINVERQALLAQTTGSLITVNKEE